MNKVIIFVDIIVSFFFFVACNSNNYDLFLKETAQSIFPNEIKQLKAIVILPSQGCGGCISEVENFLIHNSKEYDDVKFILTNIYSKKNLIQRLGDSICNSSRVYIYIDKRFINTRFIEA
jgi:hypothetical protein